MALDPEDPDLTRSTPLTGPLALSSVRFADGRYLVERVLGEGGQKRVYLARDTRLDRKVVIAVLKTGRLEEDRVARLYREARALARLGDHPHIVTIHDIGDEHGQPYIVTQFVDGGSVDALRRNRLSDGQRLSVDEVRRIGDQLCQALGHAHERGIVHRDLKPGNIWLTRDGMIKLGDFGLAVGLDLSKVTREGILLGTVAYMAPEQALGRAPEPRTDLYSLGVVLYELLTGRLPFAGDTLAAILSQHLHAAPVAPSFHSPDIPQAMDALILALLAKSPDDRPASAQAVREALAATTSVGTSPQGAAGKEVRPLDRLAAGVFVGRMEELRDLRAGLESAFAGHGRLLLVVGEPGSGKTSTTEQLLTYARVRGAQILRGHCYEGEGAPAYWPWVQLLRDFVADRSPGDLQAVMGSGAASIAQLDADIARRLPELPPIPSLEPEQARFRLFDSITGFFKQASQAAPVVVFLDDLHWADAASLLLLQFLARELKNFRVLVIGAYRDQALGRHHPLAQTLGVLAGQGLDRRIHLRGLSEADVARFVEMTTGLEPAERLVTAIYKETEGNPFFVKEVVRFLAATGQLDQASQATTWSITLPQGVREVVTRRLAQLSDESSRTLSVASVIGRDFDLGLLEQAGDLDTEQLADAIDEAVASQLIVESDGAAGQYRFSHALIRETLYEGVTSTKRARLHRRIGEFLEERARNQLDRYLPQLAHHFLQASRLGQIDKAIDYAVRAAERADQLLAFEEAVGQYTAVLRVLERRQPPDPAKHCELLLTLGDVQVKAGLADLARESFIQAATLATQLGSAESLARAALGLGAGTVTRTRLGQAIDDVQIRLLREALDRAGDRESPLHGRLLAQLALALYHAPEERAVLSEQAVMVSRRVGDPAALLAALYSRCVALEGFNSAHERLELAAEIVQVADRAGDPEMALRGHFRCYREHMELCDMAGVERELEQYTRLAERLRQPRYLWVVPYCRASLALFRGQFQESELALREALTIGRRAQDPNCTLFCSIVTYTLSFCRGALDDVERMLKGIIEKYPSTSLAWRLQLTRLYCYVDRLDEARREYEPLAARDFDDLYIDGSYVSTLVGLCTIAWYLDDRRRVEKIAQRLEPFRGLTVVAGNSGIAGGPATAGLAVAAAALGRWDEAEASFEEASATSRRLGSKPWTVWTTALYLRMLALSGRPGDQQRARARLPQALAQSHEIGMDWIMMPVEHLLSDTNTR